ncbi:MAG TPA: nuclear transport factor 2 family protein [Novosphingobium sp.]|nr:nuclear transport factor 2 family protein [Novosphingobium sp.]HZV11524.1 nuclear transport factor 2 family protein [Novosphingobium sp.]
MHSLEQRIRELEDRAELERVLLQYYTAVDTLADMDGLLACFTPDALFDVADLGLEVYRGHGAIRAFFQGVFADTRYHCHHVTNFHINHLAGDEAKARGYVIGKAEGRGGASVFVHCCYDITYVRTAQGWKISVFDEDSLVPMGDEVSVLHGRR